MKFNRNLVYGNKAGKFLVFKVEQEEGECTLEISCDDSPGKSADGGIEYLTEGYELEEMIIALQGRSTYISDRIRIKRHCIIWVCDNGNEEVFPLKESETRELLAVLEYLVPIFALGVEA